MNTTRSPQIEDSWKLVLEQEFEQAYMKDLRAFLKTEKNKKKTIYPDGQAIFHAFNSTPFDKVKVVILGQDPYHGPGQAHGLCFSVPMDVPRPPSLVNIFKELKQDLGIENDSHGCLDSWAEQGVLLLNSVLTVEHSKAASHQGKGWERFTDKVIETLSRQRSGLVFLLWGSYAHKKGAVIDQQKHLVLRSPHPSPLSAHRGFFGNGHFSKANEHLTQQGLSNINWTLPD